jgi:RNA polymerase sigma factor (sigma-70 family)
MRRGRTVHEADDLVQEAWLRMDAYARQQPVEETAAFMMRTALNLAVDAHRSSLRRGEEVELDETVHVDTSPSAEASVLAREQLVRMSAGLRRPNGKARDIFMAHRLDGLSYTEIARRQGLSVNTVEKHVAKAVPQMASWMEGW